VHRDDLADRATRLDDLPGLRRRDRHRRLVGHDVDHRLVFFDDVTGLHVPRDDLTFGDAFTDVRKLEFPASHDLSRPQ
jgi:hypothetical protein